MAIYDRWGTTVFSSTDMNSAWDGSVKGVAGKEDTYTWRVTTLSVTGKEQVYTGHVTLIR
jgi:gliding motility-associated-like protein